MADPTLKQLRYFDAVARHGHFGRAAEACAISQPALSVQIKELETLLGGALIERGPRSLALTALGVDVLNRARAILAATDDLVQHARAKVDEDLAQLKLGVIPTIAPYVLPKVIQALTARWPGLDLNVRETLTPRLIEELREGQIDCAMLALPVSEPWVTEAPMFQEEFVLVRPEADANAPVPPTDKLREERLLLLEEGHCFRDQALAYCTMDSAAPREAMDGSSLSTLVQMVDAGMGITLIPEMAVGIETRSARVAVARFGAASPRRTVGLVWRRSSPMGARYGQVAEVIAAVGG